MAEPAFQGGTPKPRGIMGSPLIYASALWLRILVGVTVALPLACGRSGSDSNADVEEWIPLFNGQDLQGWTPKIAGHDVGANYGDTFRVADGLLSVRYDEYGEFDGQFGHLFYDEPFSYYRLIVEYRFVGDQQRGAPSWALRNSGAMLHSQAPSTMPRDQDFPISVEMQFLGGLSDGEHRPTGSMCSPGTEIVYEGETAPSHCINSTSATYDGDQWVRAEVIVLGDSLILHLINGDTVLQYTKPRIGGRVVNGFDPDVKRDGTPLRDGFIALQSEGHSIDFRRVELLNLRGCMDPESSRYRRQFIASDPRACDPA